MVSFEQGEFRINYIIMRNLFELIHNIIICFSPSNFCSICCRVIIATMNMNTVPVHLMLNVAKYMQLCMLK